MTVLSRLSISILAVVLTMTAAAADHPLVIAHRGASVDAPENTVPAWQLAWEQGADGAETDLHLTADGHIVCIHDFDTARVGMRKLVVADSTLAELRALDVGVWKGEAFRGTRIPTLAELLATVPDGKLVYLEIKSGPALVPVLARELAASTVKPGQVRVITFSTDVVRETRRQLPDVTVNWLVSFKQDPLTRRWSPDRKTLLATLREFDAAGLGAGHATPFNARLIAALRAAGFGTHVWTVDDPAVARRYAVLGLDSITTNRPALILQALR